MKFTKWDWSGPEHWGADHVHLLHWVGQVHHDQTHPDVRHRDHHRNVQRLFPLSYY